VPSEKACRLRKRVILGKACYRYFTWAGENGGARGELRLIVWPGIAE
jgi:hypothetical protein